MEKMVRRKQIRRIIFLKDILYITMFSFGTQVCFSLCLERLVRKRRYLKTKDLMELHGLCNMMPGPASTQILTCIGYRVGGLGLAFGTLCVWILPSFMIMAVVAMTINQLYDQQISVEFLRFLQPAAIGIFGFSAFKVLTAVKLSRKGYFLVFVSTVCTFFFRSPYTFPILIFLGGLWTATGYRKQPRQEKKRPKISWMYLVVWAAILLAGSAVSTFSDSLPSKIFENFFRNGTIIFGGVQTLVPLLYTEFVEFKQLVSSKDFMVGFAIAQSIPGPTFCFSTYLGSLIFRDWGLAGQFLGAMMSTLGIFLPGTLIILFVFPFWESLKRYRPITASLEGVSGVSAGLIIGSSLLLLESLDVSFLNYATVFITAFLLLFTSVSTPMIILGGLAMGFLL